LGTVCGGIQRKGDDLDKHQKTVSGRLTEYADVLLKIMLKIRRCGKQYIKEKVQKSANVKEA